VDIIDGKSADEDTAAEESCAHDIDMAALQASLQSDWSDEEK
jgi:hypothetical protein